MKIKLKFFFYQVIFALLIASSVAQPIQSRGGLEDLVQTEVDLLGFFLRFLLGGGGGERSQESFNPVQLIQLGTSFLRTIGNLENLGNNNDISQRDDSTQDRRVVNYEQEINRRNQLAGVVRLFSGLLSR